MIENKLEIDLSPYHCQVKEVYPLLDDDIIDEFLEYWNNTLQSIVFFNLKD